jgi:hypothetical protein
MKPTQCKRGLILYTRIKLIMASVKNAFVLIVLVMLISVLGFSAKFFVGQYESLDEIIVKIAERIRSLGGKTPATLSEFAKSPRLEERPGKYPEAGTMVSNLLADHEKMIQNLRMDVDACGEKYHDAGILQDFLTGLM